MIARGSSFGGLIFRGVHDILDWVNAMKVLVSGRNCVCTPATTFYFSSWQVFSAQSFVSRLLGFGDVEGLVDKIKSAGISSQSDLYKRFTDGDFTLRCISPWAFTLICIGTPPDWNYFVFKSEHTFELSRFNMHSNSFVCLTQWRPLVPVCRLFVSSPSAPIGLSQGHVWTPAERDETGPNEQIHGHAAGVPPGDDEGPGEGVYTAPESLHDHYGLNDRLRVGPWTGPLCSLVASRVLL